MSVMKFPSFQIFRLYIRIFLVFAGVLYFAWIFNENIPLAGVKNISYTFGTPHGSVSQLRPMARLGESGTENGTPYQKIIESPVFFDIRTPIEYDAIRVELLYKRHTTQAVSLGIKQFPEQADFFTVPFLPVNTEGEWTLGYAEISLDSVRRLPGRYSLSLVIPDLSYRPESDAYVRVSRANVTLHRKPLDLFALFRISQ